MKKIGWITGWILGISIFAKAASAVALPDGYFRSVNNKPEFEVFIRNENIDGVQTTYAAMYQVGKNIKNTKDYEYGALFRLETLEDGSMVWTLIYQGENNLLTMLIDTPLYQSRLTGDLLTIWATPTGTSKKCPSMIELKKVTGTQWAPTSAQVALSDAFNHEAFFDTSSLQLRTALANLWSGESAIEHR